MVQQLSWLCSIPSATICSSKDKSCICEGTVRYDFALAVLWGSLADFNWLIMRTKWPLICNAGFVIKTKQSIPMAIHSDLSQNFLRVACPNSNANLFYGINDTCVHQQCGYDIAMIDYIASKLQLQLMWVILSYCFVYVEWYTFHWIYSSSNWVLWIFKELQNCCAADTQRIIVWVQ